MLVWKGLELKKYVSYMCLKGSIFLHKTYKQITGSIPNNNNINFVNDFWGNIYVNKNKKLISLPDFVLSSDYTNTSAYDKDFLLINLAAANTVNKLYSIKKTRYDYCYDIYNEMIMEVENCHVQEIIKMRDILTSLPDKDYDMIMNDITKLSSSKRTPNLQVMK